MYCKYLFHHSILLIPIPSSIFSDQQHKGGWRTRDIETVFTPSKVAWYRMVQHATDASVNGVIETSSTREVGGLGTYNLI